jgi:hypothetical protein
MNSQLVQANAVVVATNLNPTVFNQVWLTDNGIIPTPTGESQQGSVFTDVLVQAQAPAFVLTVMPQQLHFAPRAANAPGALTQEKVARIVTLLSHVPYVAVGVNFMWHSDPLADVGPIGRKLFAGRGALFDGFDTADARFGTYASKDFGLVRLRLDARPIHFTEKPDVEQIQFAFNFQRELRVDPDKPAAIIDVLSRWDEYRDFAAQLVNTALEGAIA